jgi:apolipoprotein N-acyltransferase
VAAVALSAVAWWLGTGLHPVWWIAWLATLPVLLAASRVKRLHAFAIAFAACAIGGLNMWNYLHNAIGLPLAISLLSDLQPALVFAVAVLFWRGFVLRGALFRAALSFSAVWVCYEFVLQKTWVHATFGNLSYTQMNFLPVVQLASLAGVTGISFVLLVVPAGLAAAMSGQGTARHRLAAVSGAVALLFAVLVWGAWRLREPLPGPMLRVGLIASDAPENLSPRDPARIGKTLAAYAAQAQALIRTGAELVVLPEKNAVISGDTVAEADRLLGAAARTGATVATGAERWTPSAKLNEIRVYGPDGKVDATYEKHHMLPPFESDLLPGTSLTTLRERSGTWGLAICKDMDFPALSRQYGREDAGLLIVPAWDFDADGWYHGRMAILRGVESGFSVARAAKMGVLTISDDRGRVLAQQPTHAGAFATLLALVPVHHDDTLYDRWGDWFGWLNALALAALIVSALRGSGNLIPSNPGTGIASGGR